MKNKKNIFGANATQEIAGHDPLWTFHSGLFLNLLHSEL